MKHTLKIQNAILLLSILFTSCTSCKKPIVGSSYKQGYYFYCKVNGQIFNPKYTTGLGTESIATKLLQNDSIFQINAIADNDLERVGFALFPNEVITVKNYALLKNGHAPGVGFYDKDLGTDRYETDSTFMGSISFSIIDKSKQLAEGTFSFTAYNATTHDTAHVTDGKFSLFYKIH